MATPYLVSYVRHSDWLHSKSRGPKVALGAMGQEQEDDKTIGFHGSDVRFWGLVKAAVRETRFGLAKWDIMLQPSSEKRAISD